MSKFTEDRNAAFTTAVHTRSWQSAQEFLDDEGIRLPIACPQDKFAIIVLCVLLANSKVGADGKFAEPLEAVGPDFDLCAGFLIEQKYGIISDFEKKEKYDTDPEGKVLALRNLSYDRIIPLPPELQMEGI